jgi:nicotinate-nucleotide adenylyltransferase
LNSIPPRIGLLGGSFDPPHLGHVQLARDAMTALALNEVRFVIAGEPWQKHHITDACHRLAMVELALANETGLVVEHCELERAGPSYTFETLRELRARYGPQPCLVWIMGSDQFANLHTWQHHDELTQLAHLAVAQRAGDQPLSLPSADALTFASPSNSTTTLPFGKLVSFRMMPHPAASTHIRPNPSAHADLLAPPVLAYIQAHSLYARA